MTFKEFFVKASQLLLGVIALAFVCAFVGLLVKSAYRLFMLGFNVW